MVVTAPRRPSLDLAASCLVASSAVSVVGLVALFGMFTAFGTGNQGLGSTLGMINDVLAFPTLLLMLPAVVELRRLLRPSSPALVDTLTVLGVLAMAGVLVLQGMLVAGLLPFSVQINYVSIVWVGLAAWFIGTGVVGSRAGLLPRGGRMGALAATYVGYPVWGLWLARRFRELAGPASNVAAARPAR
jgi:hypothetical protein